jgi:hypothetical protein
LRYQLTFDTPYLSEKERDKEKAMQISEDEKKKKNVGIKKRGLLMSSAQKLVRERAGLLFIEYTCVVRRSACDSCISHKPGCTL